MQITLMPLANLTKTELEQSETKILALMAAYGDDESLIDWDEQPAIIADASGHILDGHHRYTAFVRLGYTAARVLTVDDDFRALAGEIGLQAAVRDAANDAGCPYTWAAA